MWLLGFRVHRENRLLCLHSTFITYVESWSPHARKNWGFALQSQIFDSMAAQTCHLYLQYQRSLLPYFLSEITGKEFPINQFSKYLSSASYRLRLQWSWRDCLVKLPYFTKKITEPWQAPDLKSVK